MATVQKLDVKDAVAAAKQWLVDTLSDESINNLGVEEIDYSEGEKAWKITLGFSRPWNTVRNALVAMTGEIATRRAYRVITVDEETGKVKSMKRRDSDGI